MSGISSEFNGTGMTTNGCPYASLGSYNQSYFARGQFGPPTLSQTQSSEVIVVPSFGGVSYNIQQNGQDPYGTGYYTISSAYPQGGSCGVYTSNLCG